MSGKNVALVEPESTALVSWAEFEGIEDGSEDVLPQFPIVKIVQATSGMEGAQKHGGEFWRSDTEEFLPSLDFVPLFMKETRAHFLEGDAQPVCVSADGKAPLPGQRLWAEEYKDLLLDNGWQIFDQPVSCADCPFSQWVDNNPPLCGGSIVVLGDLGGGDLVQLRISGKSIKPWRSFVARLVTAKKRPLCSYRLNLYTEAKQEGAQKRWQELRVQAESLTPALAAQYIPVIQFERERFQRAVVEDHEPQEPRDVTPESNGWQSDADFGGRPPQQEFFEPD